MTLEDASKEKENYQNRLEKLKTLVTPQAVKFDKIIVDGGKHTDSILKYVELENEQQLEVTILYIKSKMKDIDEWIEKEVERLAKYGETIKAVVYLRENEFKIDDKGNKRHLYWKEIADKVYCSERSARYWYKLAVEERKKNIL